MQWTPLVCFFALMTFSVDDRYMYLVPAIVTPVDARLSTFLYLLIKAFSSSGVTCTPEQKKLKYGNESLQKSHKKT